MRINSAMSDVRTTMGKKPKNEIKSKNRTKDDLKAKTFGDNLPSEYTANLEEQVGILTEKLRIEKDLTKILLKKQTEWSQLVESVTPTIEVLGKNIKTLQNDLHLKNQELTNVLQSLSTGLIVTNLQGNILTFNRAAVAITGIEKKDALGMKIDLLLQYPILPELLDENALESIGKDYHQQFIFKKADGSDITIDSSTTLMESEESERQGIIINLNDITQLKRLEEEAERKNRLTAMGEISMQVAHEIRNPLGSIELFASMLKMDLPDESNEWMLIQHITSATQSMNHIISNLLEYTRPRPIALEIVDSHHLLKDFSSFARFSAEQQSIEIQLDLTAEKSEIKGNEQHLKQVFHNLFINACQAMPEGGSFVISSENLEVTDPVILERFNNKLLLEQESSLLTKIAFQDTGKGMSEEVRKRVFDPFFTTREQGTGLGMSIVHKTMASHGGTILIESVIDQGTRIELLFPQQTEDLYT